MVLQKRRRQSVISNNGDPEVVSDPDDVQVSKHIKPQEEFPVLVDTNKVFKKLELKGKGGFGAVFCATRISDKKMVAIKKMTHFSDKETKRNTTEIAFLASCTHRNIVSYFNSYLVNDEIWVVMEFMEGGTLSEACKGYNFEEGPVAYVAREVLQGLKYLHERQFCHRDLKSSNIMLSVHAEIKLIDFGLCVDVSEKPMSYMVGSPFWLPPEMIQNLNHGLPADVWSFAVCMLELLQKRPPNGDNSLRAMYTVGTVGLEGYVRDLKLSSQLTDFLLKCLKVDQNERATVTELLQHPLLLSASTTKHMQDILSSIFISRILLSDGVF
eukprot:TRINITY_DN8615_c0_g1_i1.p2 TRINITY_DN8615_c0_g1~~TRINITY_DN8615_c0_g1_i1.p2  ORF type:complete len:326 (-),score=58.65 TRINITY_DN8615_c0_g1_i1:35-1012(-)